MYTVISMCQYETGKYDPQGLYRCQLHRYLLLDVGKWDAVGPACILELVWGANEYKLLLQ